MRELVIGDVHFGVKSNSVEWLTKQCKLFDTQITDIIKTKDIQRVVFLGDVFDVRYSINQQVASEVKECIRKIALLCQQKNIYVVFVAGNHDYYSPLEEAARYNAYETVFGSEFARVHPNVIFVTKDPVLKDDSLFLPWYWTDNTDHFDELLYTYDFGREVTVSNPQRVITLTSSFADIWYLAGGIEQMVATTNATWTYFDLPMREDIVNLGGSKELNIEQIIACEPDLILASCGTDRNVELETAFEEMGMNVAYFL